MTDVCFSRVKLGFALIACLGMFPLGVALVLGGGLKTTLVGAAMAIAAPFLSLYVARYLLDNRILSIGATGIEYHGIVSTRRLRMDQIGSIRIETQTNKGVSISSLVIEPRDGHGRRIKLSESLLEKRFGGCEGVADLITRGAPDPEPFPLPRRAPTPPAAAPAGWHERGTQPPAAPARQGGFGRKGL
ncbi:hypothetical protein [Erythrobacter oryzae]|uniref:hypothetical protein n=1 Tax=Erythrobacter oryzae TaxID=3019556 RepID=UPI0025522396|nr:hypothetical protein [Erythrobacter sp. COR-2]